MDVRPIARWATASERRNDMADLRKCIGSAKFGIEAHEAPVADFPVQPSQRDGLGRMCKAHWRAYTNALRNAALVRKAYAPAQAKAERPARRPRQAAKKPEPIQTKPARGRKAEGEQIVAAADAALASGEANVEEASIA
jgi:hypothetical protein